MTCYKHTLAIDIETYCDLDLRAVGVYKYADSPTFEILLFAYSFDGEPAECVDLTKDKVPKKVIKALYDPEILKTAFNATFERVCINKVFGGTTGPWSCTMIRSWEIGIAGNLKNVGWRLRLPEDERKIDGSQLIRTFCKPRKPTKYNKATRWTGKDKPREWAYFIEYNARDVDAENAIRQKVTAIDILDRENTLYKLDQDINDRGIKVDMSFCNAAIKISNDLSEASQQRYKEITGIDNPNSLIALKAWIKERTGEDVGAVTKETTPQLIEQYKDKSDVVEALKIRSLLAKTSIAKYQKMIDTACHDDRSRGNTQFFGAKTGRWAGRLIQLQNLPQNHLEDLDTAREVVAMGDYEILDMIYGDPTDVLRQCIRTAIIPGEGKKFVVADFSAIEARVIAWLAGEKWRLETFENGGDIYCASAAQMFGVPVEKHGINGHLRQKGKVAELALGYAGSVGALKAMGALKMGMHEEELKPIVDKWRDASPHVVKLWHLIEDACFACIKDQQPHRINKFLSVMYEKGLMFIVLPSGRRMGYARPSLDRDELGRLKMTYEDVSMGKVKRIETYYGKLTENVVQATARDCLAHAMLALDAAGYEIVFHVHDEVIIEVDGSDSTALKNVCDIMGSPVQWAPGLPLRADGYECSYYKKD